jgi:hypothetical protein
MRIRLKINHRRHRDYFIEAEVEVEAQVEKSPHKAQKNTEIEGGR